MTAGPIKPSIFIGCSVERLDIAYAVQEHLEYIMEPTVWNQDIFQPSSYALADLERSARRFHFALFVFAPDDILTMRGSASKAVRDNIIFEFGLFVGALSLPCCFLLVPRGAESLHLPTDLLGLTPLTFDAGRSDQNLVAALGPAVNRLRRAVRQLPQIRAEDPKSIPDTFGVGRDRQNFLTAEDYMLLWNSPRFEAAREAVKTAPWNPRGYDDEEAGFYEALERLFAFLESMADAVLAGDIDEAASRVNFEQPVRALWPHMYVYLAPPNHADEWWIPLPRIAELNERWGNSPSVGQR